MCVLPIIKQIHSKTSFSHLFEVIYFQNTNKFWLNIIDVLHFHILKHDTKYWIVTPTLLCIAYVIDKFKQGTNMLACS
jgi:hypothetical protein